MLTGNLYMEYIEIKIWQMFNKKVNLFLKCAILVLIDTRLQRKTSGEKIGLNFLEHGNQGRRLTVCHASQVGWYLGSLIYLFLNLINKINKFDTILLLIERTFRTGAEERGQTS